MISYTDWIFGQLLEGLDRIDGGKLAERTAVFFASDHGDFGGDYGLVEKWPGSMADVLTRVPLYARIPGGVTGHVATAPVQTADVLETMLDLGGILLPDWIRFGQSLLPQLHGDQGQADRCSMTFSSHVAKMAFRFHSVFAMLG
jgi:choline-sulfatase